MRRRCVAIVFALLITPVLSAGAGLTVVPVNDASAGYEVSRVDVKRLSADRTALTFGIENAPSGSQEISFRIRIVNQEGICKGNIRYSRMVTIEKNGTSRLTVYLRKLSDGDRVLFLPVDRDGEESEEQGEIIRSLLGTGAERMSCLSECQSMKDECAIICPQYYCWYCSIPGCEFMDCYCQGSTDCPYPYQVGP